MHNNTNENKIQQDRLGDVDSTLDIMMFGQPNIESARINNAIKRRRRKVINKAR